MRNLKEQIQEKLKELEEQLQALSQKLAKDYEQLPENKQEWVGWAFVLFLVGVGTLATLLGRWIGRMLKNKIDTIQNENTRKALTALVATLGLLLWIGPVMLWYYYSSKSMEIGNENH